MHGHRRTASIALFLAAGLALGGRAWAEDKVLAKIDAALESNGTDKTRLLTAQIWLKDIRDRGAMNELWTAWLPAGQAPCRACVEANMADPRHLVEIMVTACR